MGYVQSYHEDGITFAFRYSDPTATCPLTAAMILGTSLTGLLLTKRRGGGRAD